MKKYILIIGLLVATFIFSCDSGNDKFVTVEDNDFILEGQTYNYLGTNMWYGPLLGMAQNPGNRARLQRELDFLKSIGITNLRIMGASEGTSYNNTVKPAFQPEPGEYNEEVLIGLDYLLSEMAKREMKAVIYLGNNWIWSGGFAQYVAWVRNEQTPNPFFPEFSWDEFINYSAKFYCNKAAKKAYNDYVNMLINRKNNITGKLYKNDPTIMAWQLANEPRPGRGEEGKENFEAFSKWIEETANYIKALDHNHLVSTGNEGLAGCIQSEDLYKKIHSFENIDYMTAHLWILNWGWFDPQHPEQTFPEAQQKAKDYIQKHIQYADNIGKPLVFSEFGIPRDEHAYSPQASTIYRNKYYNMIFNMIYENARSGGPLVGSNFWAWSGEWKPAGSQEYVWEEGDPFAGDPPQEPQGRNSVLMSDTSTIEIMKKYANAMMKIGEQ